MPRERLPLQALPVWRSLNDVVFSQVEVQPIPEKGHGLLAVTNDEAIPRTDKDEAEEPQRPLITVLRELILNAEAVEQYAKEDRNFRALLHACGQKSPRHDILLFLLVQLYLSSNPPEHIALSNPWTEYVKLLDDDVPVPTLWPEDDRLLLQGTSLEPALEAKMAALTREFNDLRDKSSDIECWNAGFWVYGRIQLADWYRVDAWYRSRVLELPRSGPSLVPCIDMANHSAEANAYYEETPDGDVVLLPRPGVNIENGTEVTISYGSDKPAAEMLFSYGFLDPSSSARTLTLPLSPFPDDPLGKAKIHIYQGTPSLQLKEVGEEIEWESPFAYLMILNEEDGLGFQVMQSSDGGRELRLFWQEVDVTDDITSFDTLAVDHPLCDVFRLRVNMVLCQRLEEQLERLSSVEVAEQVENRGNALSAQELKGIEKGILEKANVALGAQRTQLLALDSVKAYLASSTASADLDDVADGEEDDEFS